MAFNQIGTTKEMLPPLQIALAPGQAFTIPGGQGTVGTYGNVVYPQLGTNNPLSGQYVISPGMYSSLQIFDPALVMWRNVNAMPGGQYTISSDAANYRIANTTGCPIGAIITNAGSGLTNGYNTVTVTPSAGGSVWSTLVGGSINTSVTITTAGSWYTAPPILVFNPPVNQGDIPYILPAAVCTLTNGTIGSVTVTQIGAGLVSAPIITVVPQPGDSTGGGAVLTVNATLTNSGKLVVMWPAAATLTTGGTVLAVQQVAPYGAAQTSVVTFTFSPASTIAATAIMNFTITSFTTNTSGSYSASSGVLSCDNTISGATAASANPFYDKNLAPVPVLPAIFVAPTTGVPTLTGKFGGVNLPSVPVYTAVSAGTTTTAASISCNVGGSNDISTLTSI